MTTSTKNKIIVGAIIVVALALFWGGCQYQNWKTKKSTGIVIKVTKDSIRIVTVPIPYRIGHDSIHYVRGKDVKPVHDTTPGIPEIIIEPNDTAAIIARFLDTAFYHHLIDTGRWNITVDESVTGNRIRDWSLKAVSSDTLTTITTVKTIPKKFIGYLDFEAMGNLHEPFYGGGIGLSLKGRNDMILGVKYWLIRNQRPMVSAGMSLPIHLLKRR